MKVLLLSCLFYLISITIVLYFRPSLMFENNGNWKEFGFLNDDKHTWFPFWLYCIVSAFVSYALSYFIYTCFDDSEVDVEYETHKAKTKGKIKKNTQMSTTNSIIDEKAEMKSGYYVLDKESYEESGIPKYIFLGSNKPNENE